MHGVAPLILLLALAPAGAGCGARPRALGQAAPSPTPAVADATPAATHEVAAARPDEGPRELLGDLAVAFERVDALDHNGYEVSKKVRRERLASGNVNEIEYAVISRGGRRVAELRGFTETGFGAFVRMGLFPVLGGDERQLVVEQTVNRGWLYWVVDLSSARPRVVFESGDYPVGHSLRAADLDGDGRFELIQTLHTFWFFNAKLNNVNSPFIDVVFRYDPRAGTYAPANHLFPDFALRGVRPAAEKVSREREKLKAGGGYDGDLLGAVLEGALSHLYAGREAEGWAFYEQYDSPDREQIKGEVRKALARDPVYRAAARGGRAAAARD